MSENLVKSNDQVKVNGELRPIAGGDQDRRAAGPGSSGRVGAAVGGGHAQRAAGR